MDLTNDDAIEHLSTRMLARTLPKAEWTHEAHFAVALWLLRHRPEGATPDAMRRFISAYNDATGTPNTDSEGYHHTITVASLRAAASMLGESEQDTLHAILARLMRSEYGKSDWILRHWSKELLFSTAARREWIEPDLGPLPF